MTKQVFAVLVLMFILVSCDNGPTYGPLTTKTFIDQEAIVQEVTFKSSNFEIVGDLRLPAEGEMHPAIIMVHGDGPATRDGAVQFTPMIRRFLRHGYAVFSWDKPGSGKSTGELNGEHKLTERAAILAEAVEVLADNPAVDKTRIGLWGLSQAGWVMPLALELTDNVAFMIVVSGGAEDGVEQYGYHLGQRILSAGGSPEDAAIFEQYFPRYAKATRYDQYRQAMEMLNTIPDVETRTGMSMAIAEEEKWHPWPQDIDAFIDPMTIIERTTIPMLVFFGEWDKNIDPVQGVEAYEKALQMAGNQDYQIVVLSGVAHVFTSTPEYLDTLELWLQHLSS